MNEDEGRKRRKQLLKEVEMDKCRGFGIKGIPPASSSSPNSSSKKGGDDIARFIAPLCVHSATTLCCVVCSSASTFSSLWASEFFRAEMN